MGEGIQWEVNGRGSGLRIAPSVAAASIQQRKPLASEAALRLFDMIFVEGRSSLRIEVRGVDRSAERARVYERHVLRFQLRKAEPGPEPSRWWDQPTGKQQNTMRFQDISKSTICKVNRRKTRKKERISRKVPGAGEKVNKS